MAFFFEVTLIFAHPAAQAQAASFFSMRMIAHGAPEVALRLDADGKGEWTRRISDQKIEVLHLKLTANQLDTLKNLMDACPADAEDGKGRPDEVQFQLSVHGREYLHYRSTGNAAVDRLVEYARQFIK